MITKIKTLIKKQFSVIRLKKAAKNSDIRIVIGASNIYDEGWTPTEVDYLNLTNEQDWKYFFRPNSISAILAEHVWEHLTIEEGFEGASNCFKYLKKGGYLRIAVPDGFNPNREYIDYVKPGGHGAGADDHKVLYDHMLFTNMLEKIGYEVKLLEWHDKTGIFHYEDWSPSQGRIIRSRRFDERNKNGVLNYTSLIIDAIKQ